MGSQTVAHIELVEELEARGLLSLQHLQTIKFRLSCENRADGGACQLYIMILQFAVQWPMSGNWNWQGPYRLIDEVNKSLTIYIR